MYHQRRNALFIHDKHMDWRIMCHLYITNDDRLFDVTNIDELGQGVSGSMSTTKKVNCI